MISSTPFEDPDPSHMVLGSDVDSPVVEEIKRQKN